MVNTKTHPATRWLRKAMLATATCKAGQLICAGELPWAAKPLAAPQSPDNHDATGMHQHAYAEVCVALDRPLMMDVATHQFAMRPPSVAVLDAGVPHAEGFANRLEPYTVLWMGVFGSSAFAHVSRYEGRLERRLLHRYELRSRMVGRLTRCLAVGREGRARGDWAEVLRACLLGIFAEAWLEHSQRRAKAAGANSHRYEHTLSRLKAFLDSHLDQRHSVTQLGQLMRLSPNYLNYLFTHWSGESLHHYLLGRRMEKAMELCRRGELLVKEIALKVGYRDPLYFSRAFHKYHGVWPTEVRRG